MADAARLVNGRNVRHDGWLTNVQLLGGREATTKRRAALSWRLELSDVISYLRITLAIGSRCGGLQLQTWELFDRVTFAVATNVPHPPWLVRPVFERQRTP